MMNDEIYIRFTNAKSQERIAKRFGLFWHKNEQDWELIASKPEYISDFLKVYQTELEDDDDKFTLMGLIISSFDDIISERNEDTMNDWEICKIILEKECFLHYAHIKYWSLLDEFSDNVFDITPLMREVWYKIEGKFL